MSMLAKKGILVAKSIVSVISLLRYLGSNVGSIRAHYLILLVF